MLSIGLLRLVVTNILKSLIPHRANDIIRLIYPVPMREDILPRLFRSLISQKGLPLEILGDRDPDQRENRWPQVYERNQVFPDGTRGDFARPADQQGYLQAAVIAPA